MRWDKRLIGGLGFFNINFNILKSWIHTRHTDISDDEHSGWQMQLPTKPEMAWKIYEMILDEWRVTQVAKAVPSGCRTAIYQQQTRWLDFFNSLTCHLAIVRLEGWTVPGESKLKQVKVCLSFQKIMDAVFWTAKGILHRYLRVFATAAGPIWCQLEAKATFIKKSALPPTVSS